MENNNTKPFYNSAIPRDWKIKKLKEILIEGRLGGNYENAEANLGVPVIKMGNLDRAAIKIDKIQYLPEKENYNEEDVLKNGDLLFNTRNTLELVGKVAIWKNELPLAVYNSNLMRMKFDMNYVESTWYMNYAFNSHYGLSQLRGIATGTTSVAAIYGRDLETIKFLLPPLPEQRAIAQVLSSMDTAINKNNQLIAQKELRKKWLMQNLLTGKKRLKGFSVDWEEYQLREIFSERNERNTNDLPLLSIGQNGVYPQDESIKKDTSNSDKSKYKRICKGDIGYNTMRMWQGRSALSELEGIVSPAYTILKPKQKSEALFFAYLFKTPKVINLFWRNSQGLVNDTLNCKYKDFSIVKVLLPKREEQTAIAQVLQAADKEIQLLKAKTEKLRDQKKGMMQVLLTGRKRLRVN